MIKIWNEAFLKKQPENHENQESIKLNWADYVPLAILATASVLMGVFAATVFTYTMEAANQLIDPTNYIDTVLRNRTP
jgi:multicomponent Na+:H+ antiporter subunit D